MNEHDMNMRTLHCIARWPNRKGLVYKTEGCLADELDGNENSILNCIALRGDLTGKG